MTMNDDMNNNVRLPGPKKYLWYIAFFLVLPAWGYGIRTGTLPLALLGLPVFVLLMYLSFTKLICPECGKTMRTISTTLSNCPHCGASYDVGSRPIAPRNT